MLPLAADADGTPTNQAIWIVPATPPLTPNPIAVHGATLRANFEHEYRSQELRLAGESERLAEEIEGTIMRSAA